MVLILGGIPGAFLGAWLISIANPSVFRFLIGLIALGFVAYQFSRDRGWIRVGGKPIAMRWVFCFPSARGSPASSPMRAGRWQAFTC